MRIISDRVFDLFAEMPEPFDHLCGVDEAGRGPLAGPVSAAAVILDADRPIAGLADSKVLSAAERNRLAIIIRRDAAAFAIAFASVEEIDEINILQATMLAMRRAVMALSIAPRQVLVDGNRCPVVPYPVRAIVKGDFLVPSISAASILAKTARDALMQSLAGDYPVYGFDRHKGYGTKAHVDALQRHGPCAAHRRSFGPVREAGVRLNTS